MKRRGEKEPDELRRRAEKKLAALKKGLPAMGGEEPLVLIHELQVHQIELNMQNEELQHAREDAEKLREKYQDLFDFAPIGYFTLDRKGTITEANLAGATLLNRKRSSLVDAPFARFLDSDSSVEFEQFRRRIFAGTSGARCEVRLGGTATPRWALLEGIAVSGENGRTAGRVAMIDVTDRKQAEEALRFSEARYRALYRDNPTMIATLDTGLRMLSVNPFCAGQLGYTAEELEGQPVLMIFLEDDRPAVAEQLRRCLQNPGQVHRWQFRKVRKDGGVLWVEEIAQAVLEPGGTLNILVVCQDITERKEAEEALAKSEKQLSKIFQSVPAMIGITTLAEGRFIDINEAGLRVLGYRREEIIGHTSLELGIWKNRSDREELTRAVEKRGKVSDLEFIFVCKGGKTFTGLMSAELVEFGGERHMLGMVQDITERKRTEEALKESEERFRALVTASSEVIYVMSPDWSEMRELYIKEFLASTESPSRTWLEKYIHPDDQPHVTAVISEAIRTKSIFELEHRVWRADGSLGWTFSRAVPLLDAHGEIVEWFGAASDITDRKQAEDALQESEEKFSIIFNMAPVGITISTLADGRFVDINAAGERFSGYQRDEVIGHTAQEFDIWKDPEERARTVDEILKQGGVRDREMMMKDKGGKVFWASYSAVVVEMRGEKYLLSLVSDITDRKKAEGEIERLNTDLAARASELEGANRELEAFNYTVAHDLRKPLTVVNGYCQAVMELCSDRLDEQCTAFLRDAYNGTMRMNSLIDALLNFSRMAHVDLNRETVDLSTMAKVAVAELKLADTERRVTFRIADAMTVNGDAKLLRVVLDNLLGNAWKYTGSREEGIIDLGVAEIYGKPTYFVRDNGPGFDMADAEKLFIPFQRLPGAEEFRGFGIGLATVERIIRRHGGRVWAEGEPGKGATFWFTLPADGT